MVENKLASTKTVKKPKLEKVAEHRTDEKVVDLNHQISTLSTNLEQEQQKVKMLEKAKADHFFKMFEKSAAAFRVNDPMIGNSFLATYSRIATERTEIMRAIDDVSSFYITNVILNQFIEDAFCPETKSNEILEISSPNPDVKKELKYLQKLYDFDELAKDVAYPAIKYGEYIMSTRIVKGRGLVDLVDDVDQQIVIPLVKRTDSAGYLVLEPKRKELRVKPDSAYIKFVMNGQRIRINLQEELLRMKYKQEYLDSIPRYIRMGQSVIYPVIDKIRDLDLLERLVPATKLQKISNGTLLGVSVPEGIELETSRSFCDEIEQFINKKTSVHPATGFAVAQNIIEAAGRFKVVPQFGGTGDLKKLDYAGDEPDKLLDSVEKIRAIILDSVSIPAELIFSTNSKEGEKKVESLKRYARYLRKLKSIQMMVVDGLKQIVFIHLANKDKNKYKNIKDSDIIIKFRNDLIELDNLDRLEFIDTTVSFVKQTHEFVASLMKNGSGFSEYINKAEYVKWLHNNFSTVNLDIIDYTGKGKPLNGGEGGGDLSISSPRDEKPTGGETPLEEVPTEETPTEVPPAGVSPTPAPGKLLP